jgi:serine phosphatase RsbU (regulator of sigma subunit)
MIEPTTNRPEADDEILLLDDDDSVSLTDDIESTLSPDLPKWRVLIVDDEEEIHQVTRLALNRFRYMDRGVVITSAYSGTEAREVLRSEPPFAVIFLDVVMETDDAGLQLVNFIRSELNNRHTRIILRTGQPGVAPEAQIITRYDIDDYKAKTELTVQKLHTCLVSSLRTYNEVMRIEGIVQERTAELMQKNRDIMDSINYARRIQTAILPSLDYINQYLPNFFVFYKPKDVLSGDFYWFSQLGNFSVVAAVDCTGHGIPGAIMSVIGYNLLGNIVNEQKIVEPSIILQELDARLIEILQRESKDADDYMTLRDGMDMSLIVIDHKKRKLTFSGANRPMYLIRDMQIIEYAGSRAPIGDTLVKRKEYSEIELPIQTGDRLYMFTDGIVDQFGGQQGRKYTAKRLKEFLIGIQHLPIGEQVERLEQEFQNWKNDNPQTDDICFLGLQLM